MKPAFVHPPVPEVVGGAPGITLLPLKVPLQSPSSLWGVPGCIYCLSKDIPNHDMFLAGKGGHAANVEWCCVMTVQLKMILIFVPRPSDC